MSQIPPTVSPGPPAYVPPPSRGGGGKWVLIIVGVVALIGVVICAGVLVMAIPTVRGGVRIARQGMSQLQMMEIASALRQYANANGGSLPEAGADWQARIAAYMPPRQPGAPDPFISPRDPATRPGYIYAAPGDLSKIADPSKVIVLYENPAGIPEPGEIGVIRADWQPSQVSRDQLPKKE